MESRRPSARATPTELMPYFNLLLTDSAKLHASNMMCIDEAEGSGDLTSNEKRLADLVADFCASKLDASHVFTVTGGGAMYLNDAFGKHPDIEVVPMHHEQSASMAAEGLLPRNWKSRRLSGNDWARWCQCYYRVRRRMGRLRSHYIYLGTSGDNLANQRE